MCKIMDELKKPFDENELEFKVGATNPDKTKGLALAYVQARAIQNRLDQVFGIGGWKVSYREITGGFICNLAVRVNEEWIEKEDGSAVTDFESIKGGISSAFKRVAASGFGIGRYLYSVRNTWHPIKQQGKSYIFVDTPKLELNDKVEYREKVEETKVVKNVRKDEQTKCDEIESLRRKTLTFGKYNGTTLDEIYHNDKGYFKYLLDKAKDQDLLEACQKLKKHYEEN